MSLTAAQQQAVSARGNVLVVAGAGTGKTRTLVERCLDCLQSEKPRASLEEILLVTFTEAAAAEMRERLRRRLEDLARESKQAHWREQLALFETAHIGTLHSFCLQLVREHFYELELDPQLAVLAEEEARLLAQEKLDELLEKHYGARGPHADAIRQLLHDLGDGRDQPVRELLLRLHTYTQTRPDPDNWMKQQLEIFAATEPGEWRQWLTQALAEWPQSWLSVLEAAAVNNDIAAQCLAALRPLPGKNQPHSSMLAQPAPVLAAIQHAGENCPRGKKKLWHEPLKEFFREAKFLESLVTPGAQPDPLLQDWTWVRPQMTTLLNLTREFTRAFSDTKRELGVVDFHDLEQHALRLLWDNERNQPTEIARHWRRKLRFIFVDEYQDINAAQDKIIEALSGEGPRANRFLVGDVKQSIYRFRLAEPRIFQRYLEQWQRGSGQAIPLVDNFRSREGILDFINSLFGLLMRPAVGGVSYDENARLRFGAPEERRQLSRAADTMLPVELHLRLKTKAEAETGEDVSDMLAEVKDLEEADKEARLVGLRLLELKAHAHPVWDESAQEFRPVQWRDMAVLLRAPARKAESYAKEFSRLNVPLQVVRGGFYESLEVADLLNLLHLLDNPLQDLPLLAVLHSPLVGLTLNELAAVRLALPKVHFWTALNRWQEINRQSPSDLTPPAAQIPNPKPVGSDSEETRRKIIGFLDRFSRWRRLARQVSLSRCLETVLTETHYAAWLLTQPRGEQRHANVQRLVALAQQFDQFQRQGLFRFLRFIEAQQLAAAEPEVAAVSEEDAVRLMSIHQSKGLEFPVVVAADLGKSFNLVDLRAALILDETYGLCPQIHPPHAAQSYPSLPYWLARRRQTAELLGEELRLLYVALTRARDLLLLSAAVPERKFNQAWQQKREVSEPDILAARSYADWLALWFAKHTGSLRPNAREGRNALLRWSIHDDAKLTQGKTDLPVEPADSFSTAEPAAVERLKQRLSWQYGFAAATRQPAKTSVSLLRRQAATEDDEAASIFQPRKPDARPRSKKDSGSTQTSIDGLSKMTATELGEAHHKFQQWVTLEKTGGVNSLKQEAARLEQAGVLSAEEASALNFAGLAAFWESDLGRKIRDQAPAVRRELPFTARFAATELAQFTGQTAEVGLDGEFVVVQGVADLVVVLPRELWLVDFKTDHVAPESLPPHTRQRAAPGLAGKTSFYAPQLRLYARALSRIYRRPVTQCWLYFLMAKQAVEVDVQSLFQLDFNLALPAQP